MKRPKVLVVDDDQNICDLVAWGLDDSGYEVLVAFDGKAALDTVQRIRPDAIVLDMRMPVMNGWEFIEEYRKLPGPHAPIVVTTAYLDPGKIASEVGAQGCISKPFDLLTLSRMLRGLVSE